jgi:rhodanese-related sulfurtransferase
MQSFFRKIFGPRIPTISAVEARERLKQKPRPLLLDVRTPEEFHTGHIDGAKSLPLRSLPLRLNELSKSQEILCVCASGSRSSQAVKTLVGAGYNATNLAGGMQAWVKAGLPVKR